ncbi:hypothetical protein Tco_0536300 [Tanacetum coccineum]
MMEKQAGIRIVVKVDELGNLGWVEKNNHFVEVICTNTTNGDQSHLYSRLRHLASPGSKRILLNMVFSDHGHAPSGGQRLTTPYQLFADMKDCWKRFERIVAAKVKKDGDLKELSQELSREFFLQHPQEVQIEDI